MYCGIGATSFDIEDAGLAEAANRRRRQILLSDLVFSRGDHNSLAGATPRPRVQSLR